MNNRTLTLKKQPADNSKAATSKKPRFEDSLLGKPLVLATKNHGIEIHGTLIAIDGGWFEIDGFQYRRLMDGTISSPIMAGRFTIDRSAIAMFCEVA